MHSCGCSPAAWRSPPDRHVTVEPAAGSDLCRKGFARCRCSRGPSCSWHLNGIAPSLWCGRRMQAFLDKETLRCSHCLVSGAGSLREPAEPAEPSLEPPLRRRRRRLLRATGPPRSQTTPGSCLSGLRAARQRYVSFTPALRSRCSGMRRQIGHKP